MADKEEKDKAYAEGVKDGKKGGTVGDIVQSITPGPYTNKELDNVYDKGYKFGMEHRYDGSQKDEGSKTASRESSSSDDHSYNDRNYGSGSTYSSSSSIGRTKEKGTGSKILSVIAWILGIWIGLGLLSTLLDILNEASKHHRWPF